MLCICLAGSRQKFTIQLHFTLSTASTLPLEKRMQSCDRKLSRCCCCCCFDFKTWQQRCSVLLSLKRHACYALNCSCSAGPQTMRDPKDLGRALHQQTKCITPCKGRHGLNLWAKFRPCATASPASPRNTLALHSQWRRVLLCGHSLHSSLSIG